MQIISHATLKVEVIPSEESSYWFQPAKTSKAFHCEDCGGFLFYRQHRIIAMVQDNLELILKAPPLTFKCRKCNHLYKIHIL